MIRFPVRSLWPARDRVPVLRLVLALAIAPAIIAALFSLLAFVIAGMTEATSEAVLRVTAETAVALSALILLFTMTFGLAGIALLWRLARRGVIAWALTGGAAGAIAGVLFSALAMRGFYPSLVLAFTMAGWGLFLLIRRIAGIRDVPGRG